MGYIQGIDRDQLMILPECLDDYITEDNSVRVIDAFVESLELKEKGFLKATPAKEGRPPYDPHDLLKLYIYGYMNRIRSSRRLEKEATRNLELIWLINKLHPDFKTIADFRKDNKEAVKEVFKQFVMLCKGWELFGTELITVDSSKFKAWNGKKKNFNTEKLNKKIKDIEQKITDYLEELDENDAAEPTERKVTTEEIKKRIEQLKQKQLKYEQYKEMIKETGETQISLTDSEARSMVNNQKVEVCYNVQTTVEEKNKLILDYEVTNDTRDQGHLSVMGNRAKEILGVEKIEALADKGYYLAVDIKQCVDDQINPYIPKPENPNATQEEGFRTKDFQYDQSQDLYICPAQVELTFNSTFKKDGKIFKRYNNRAACKVCPLKAKCNSATRNGRNVDRWEHQDILDQVELQTTLNWEKYRKRQWIAEHPFGTIKRGFDAHYLLTKGKSSVGAEIGLIYLIYNLKRVMNIIGVKELRRRLAEV